MTEANRRGIELTVLRHSATNPRGIKSTVFPRESGLRRPAHAAMPFRPGEGSRPKRAHESGVRGPLRSRPLRLLAWACIPVGRLHTASRGNTVNLSGAGLDPLGISRGERSGLGI
jgi:hypothetical protein